MISINVDRDLQNQFVEFLNSMGFLAHEFGGLHTDRNKLDQSWVAVNGGHSNGIFIVRPYSWGECSCDDFGRWPNCDCSASWPNFEHLPSGFKMAWYKYPLRGAESNILLTSSMIDGWKNEMEGQR